MASQCSGNNQEHLYIILRKNGRTGIPLSMSITNACV
jgi:hypothetical protein